MESLLIFVRFRQVALREFTEHANNLQSQLDEFERVLNQRISSSIARDTLTLEHMVLQHKEFETDLKVSQDLFRICFPFIQHIDF